jgi:hypothetical protein
MDNKYNLLNVMFCGGTDAAALVPNQFSIFIAHNANRFTTFFAAQ